MGLNRIGRRSRESQAPASESPGATPAKPHVPKISQVETNQINELIKASVTNGDTNAIRERRASRDFSDATKHVKLAAEPRTPISLEAKAINDLIKQAHSDEMQTVLRERRKSKEIMTQNDAKRNEDRQRQHDFLDQTTGEPRFDPLTLDSIDAPGPVEVISTDRTGQKALAKPPSGNEETRQINKLIAEDKRKRRSSKEHAETEKHRRASSQRLADVEQAAEESALAQSAAMSGAVARGAAKAAATKADGKFLTHAEWNTLHEKLSRLESNVSSLSAERAALQAQVNSLREEGKASRSVLVRISDGFRRTDGSTGSPFGTRAQSGSEGGGSGHAGSFVKKMHDASSDSFVARVIRSSLASPSMKRKGEPQKEAAQSEWYHSSPVSSSPVMIRGA